MDRRRFLASMLAAATRPATNVVFILADDLGWRDLSCYGNPNVPTPNIDTLARDGARFTQAYAACPVCSPTRASILTGRYPVRTGVTDWIPGRQSHQEGPIVTPRTADHMRLEEQTIAERLKAANYRSAAVGKWHLGGEGFLPSEQGFALNVGGTHRGSPPPSGDKPSSYFGPAELPNLKLAAGEFLTERLTGAATQFIEQNKANPFFLYLSHYTPHIPLQAREADIARHRAKSEGRYNPIYGAMLESLDASVGSVLRTLDQNGLAKNTMVVFFSDNGGLRYEGTGRNAVTDNAPLRAGKGHLYEGGIREPLLMRLPGVIRPGAVIDTPVCSVDFLPTFCDLAGTPAGTVDGVSLLPLLRGGQLKPRPLFWHYPHYSNQGGEPGSVIRDADWKLIEFLTDGRMELFNLKDDPGEHVNLIQREPGVARSLSARLSAWRRESGAVMPQKNPAANPAWPGWNLTGAERPTPAQ